MQLQLNTGRLVAFALAGLSIFLVSAPSERFSPSEYEYNIWPKLGAARPGNTEMSDFAPDNSDALVSVAAPEPATMSLVGATSLIAFGLLRSRKRTVSAINGGSPNLQ